LRVAQLGTRNSQLATGYHPRMFLLYELLLVLGLIVALPYLALRRKYRANFRERLGFYRTASSAHDLWIHAVSVGETIAARPVVGDVDRLHHHHHHWPGAGAAALPQHDGHVLSVRLRHEREALPPPPRAARVCHDGDGDLAERDASGSRARVASGVGERPHLR